MGDLARQPSSVRNYFVDEAGNAELFDAKGRVIVGTGGCSRFIMMGLLDVTNPKRLAADMEKLRTNLVSDPYFKGVPSMQNGERKTALFFHAKDDVPEVRREMFALLRRHHVRFYAVIRDKRSVAEYVRRRNAAESGYRYKPNDLYDELVQPLFNGLLHKHDAYNVYFARRIKWDQSFALRTALESVQSRFQHLRPGGQAASLNITVCLSHERAELQAVDYFLWALQRLYERREDRYLELLQPAVRVVHDMDDTREFPRGVEYTKKRPLSLAALKD